MRYGTRYGSQIARDMTAGPPGGVSSVLDWRARDERIADFIAAGYARQAAAKEAEYERNRLTPTPADRMADWAARMDREAAVKRGDRAWQAAHGPAPTGIPEREPGSLERGRALWADQQRRRG